MAGKVKFIYSQIFTPYLFVLLCGKRGKTLFCNLMSNLTQKAASARCILNKLNPVATSAITKLFSLKQKYLRRKCNIEETTEIRILNS